MLTPTADAYLEILKLGLISVRFALDTRDPAWARVMADHLHNVPECVRGNAEAMANYRAVEIPILLKALDARPAGSRDALVLDSFPRLWQELP